MKRGMSTIIVTVIMITLVLAAVGVVWTIVQNILSESAEEISLGTLKIRLNVENVKVNADSIDVRVKRSPGAANLVGIKFIISDGEDTQVFEENTTMGELATQTFNLEYKGIVKSVEIAPILETESGKKKIGNIVDKEELGDLKINLNIGSVIINQDSIDVTVNRGEGVMNLIKIKFIVSDGVTSEPFELATTIGESETYSFNLIYTNFVKSVEIIPILETATGKEQIGEVAYKEEVSRKSCLELFQEGSIENGVYWVALIDGELPIEVYCDMTTAGGGWTLMDNFISTLDAEVSPYTNALNGSAIDSAVDLDSAGWTRYLTAYDTSVYHREPNYLQMFYSSTPRGYIEKSLPEGFDEVYIKWGNWYGGTSTLSIGGTSETLAAQVGAKIYQGSYSQGDTIKFEENGIFWVGEIWVR